MKIEKECIVVNKRLIGIDIGGTTIKIAFLSWEGEVLAKWEIPTNTANKGASILSDIATSIHEKIAGMGLTIADFKAAGVGVPGPVQLKVGYLPIAVNLGGFGDVNINEELGKLLGIPVITDNDANVAALGEMWLGSADGSDNVVFFTLGTGVGGGIITNGQIISGFSGAGGEIGHMPIVPLDSELCFACNCGAEGCLETVCSATGVVRIAEYYLEKNSEIPTSLTKGNITAKSIFDAAKENDILALQIVDTFGRYLAQSLELLSVVINPEVFVIGGGVSQAGTILIDAIQKYYGTNIFASAVKNVNIVLAKLGNDAGVIGAARHARGLFIYE